MKKLLLSILIAAALFTFVACDNNADAPDGMQLASGGDDVGYYFYVPEEWILSNVGDISAAYISMINTTSVSFAEVKLAPENSNDDYFFNKYFAESMEKELKAMEGFTIEKPEGEDAKLGSGEFASDRAKQYIYSYKYPTFNFEDTDNDSATKPVPVPEYHQFTFMQLLASHEGHYYILTYSGMSEAAEGAQSNYETYLNKLNTVITNFKFVTATGKAPDEEAPTYDADGFKLASDRGKAGFELYIPGDFNVSTSDAMVSASHADGSSIIMTETTSSGVSWADWWEIRKAELSAFASDITVVDGRELVPSKLGNNSTFLYGDNPSAYEFEYTYITGGEKFHVKQIIAVNGTKGYVFTYTAKDANYAAHINDINKVIEKVKF